MYSLTKKASLITACLSLFLIPNFAMAKDKVIEQNLPTTWSYHPESAAKPQEVDTSKVEKSFLITKDGEKVPWVRKDTQSSPGTVGTMDFCSSGDGCSTFYDFSYYAQSNGGIIDKTHFYIGEVSASNNGSGTGSIQYTQQNSTTTTWTFSGKVSVDAEFGNALIAKGKLSVGFDVSRQRQNYSSNTTSASYTVPPYTNAVIKAYNYGVYSGGYGVYDMYDESNGNHTYMGQYSEFGDAWTVAENQVNYSFSTN